ncbi:cytochrome c3 family protein [Desulfuromonas thiophila]|uniref:cytochrome c3 family protein n=1 Tax=Desulfuromonas thiophila TaxID=57664 RepID=UPI0024A7F903|nr:cytochrome c3 family protein [Desulfuromonas thiophila]
MEKTVSRWVVSSVLAAALLLAAVPLWADTQTCLECHEDVVTAHDFAASVHGASDIGCQDCHVVADLDAHMEGEALPPAVDCATCHDSHSADHAGSVHAQAGVGCVECHDGIHRLAATAGNKQSLVNTCSSCHEMDGYAESVHGQAVAEGNADSASCGDCHGVHGVQSLSMADAKTARQFGADVCIRCHGDEEMMERNGVYAHAVHTYLASYHGKSYRLGYPELTATCADCHESHAVFGQHDPRASIHEDNRAATCGKCHEGSTRLFSYFYSHGDHSDFDNYPVLAITFWAMTTLLIGTFSVFWLHSILWMIRGLAENKEKKAALARGEAHIHIPDGHRVYKRFKPYHIFMHLLVIISFLILSLTGLPLKFADQHWAKVMMDWYGGTANAAFGHRIGAVITFVYFGMALVLSIHFLFIRKDIPGIWLQRLFGPDSLMPNFRDIKDVTAMVRWFLWKGPKPTFERWNYWEKFDFIAVFWGMFAIGGSGLMLWFPEFFGLFLPGWVFNVATIVHSDEALLATGFIFSVHFFNTHLRPEKFPMDFVIFNGEMHKEEFVEERGDQWKRYEQLGITEQFVKDKSSSPLYNLILRTFGFVAVAIGVVLFVLILFSVLTGSH